MSKITSHNMILKYEKGTNDKGESIFSTEKVKVALNATEENIIKCGSALGTLLISKPLVLEELINSLS